MTKQEAIECLDNKVTCCLSEPRKIAIEALHLYIDLEDCIEGCCIDMRMLMNIINKYFFK